MVGFPGYQVSEDGWVRSYNRVTYTDYHGERHWKDRLIPQQRSAKDGYMRVQLNKNHKRYVCLVHRLVAEAFMPSDCNLTVNHKDGDKSNNHIDNLEWITLADNIRHAMDNGLNRCRKKIVLIDDIGNEISFDSHTKASHFLGRTQGYIYGCLMEHRNPISTDGKHYLVKGG